MKKFLVLILMLLPSLSFAVPTPVVDMPMLDTLDAYIKIEQPDSTISKDICDKMDVLFYGKSPAPEGTIAKKVTRLKNIANLRPCGYIAARGQLLHKTDYPELFKNIQCNWGCNSQKNFNLPQFATGFFRR